MTPVTPLRLLVARWKRGLGLFDRFLVDAADLVNDADDGLEGASVLLLDLGYLGLREHRLEVVVHNAVGGGSLRPSYLFGLASR